MKVVKLIANNTWAILVGDILIDIDGQRFFDTINEVESALSPKGLYIKNNEVIAIGDTNSDKFN